MLIEYTRPACVKQYAKQVEFIDTPERYTIVEASTKAGKTTGCIVWLFEQALQGKSGSNYWWVAPVYAQARIVFRRLCSYISNKTFFEANKAELFIKLANGAVIYFKSADNSDALYGDDVQAVVIDEASRMDEQAWYAVRSTLTKTKGRVKIIGNVKGTSNWAYKQARSAEAGQPNWKYFRLTADDAARAGILDPEEIKDAANTLPKSIFLELYYGIPNQSSADKFCFSFSEQKHVTPCAVDLRYPVYLSFDFNRNPICCTVIQHMQQTIKVTHCIKLHNSNIYNLCKVIKAKFPNALFVVTGDATGKAGSALTADNKNYYRIIQQQLTLAPNQFKVPNSNPPLEENQVLVNGILEHYKVQIDPDNAQALIFDCKFVSIGPDGKIIKADRTKPEQQADALDTFRYWCNAFMANFIAPPT